MALHSRLAHVGAGAIGRLQPGLKQNEQLVIQSCPACIQAKMVRRPYLDVPPEQRATKPGKVISADVFNPSATSAGGARYLLVVVVEAAKMFVYTYNLLPRKKLGERSPWLAFT